MEAALNLYESPVTEAVPSIEAVPVSRSQVVFSDDARVTIGEAFRQVAWTLCCDPRALTRGATGEILWHPGTDTLSIRLDVPELEAEMYIEIPEGHWSFIGASEAKH